MSAEVAKPLAVSCIPIAGFKDVYDVSCGRKSPAGALAHRERGAAHALREDGAPRRPALHGQALGAAGDGAPVRRAAELHRGARGHPQAPRAVHRLERLDRAAADAAARRSGHRQDALRAQGGGAARHRLRLRADELAHRRLGALGRLLAVEERQAGQGVRHLPERRLRQPGDRGRRARQGERRQPVRSRSARSTSCWKCRPRRASSTSSSSCRSTPPARCGSPPPTTRDASRSRCSTA